MIKTFVLLSEPRCVLDSDSQNVISFFFLGYGRRRPQHILKVGPLILLPSFRKSYLYNDCSTNFNGYPYINGRYIFIGLKY